MLVVSQPISEHVDPEDGRINQPIKNRRYTTKLLHVAIFTVNFFQKSPRPTPRTWQGFQTFPAIGKNNYCYICGYHVAV